MEVCTACGSAVAEINRVIYFGQMDYTHLERAIVRKLEQMITIVKIRHINRAHF